MIVANEEIFLFGSTAPGAILYDSRGHFDKQNPKADDNLRSIRPQLAVAVDACIEAAGNSFDPTLQKALLKAASFGKSFLDSYPTNKLADMVRSIRILNSLRSFDIGIPLTYKQMQYMTIDRIVHLLTSKRHFGLAKSICEYSNLPVDSVLVQWACLKVKAAVEDEQTVISSILDKMSHIQGISFAPVAKEAYRYGKVSLATKLLEYEPSSADQVPLLLSMQQDDVALGKAVASNETDLVYLTILHIKRKISAPDLFRMVSGYPLACSLLESYLGHQEPDLLKDFYYQDDRRKENASLLVNKGYLETNLTEKIQIYKNASKLYSQDKETLLEYKVSEEEIKLITHQINLEKDIGQSFLNLSTSETILKCLVLGHKAQASKIKYDLRVSDRRYAWLELEAMVQTGIFDGLESFIKSYPKFGYKGVIDLFIKSNYTTQALRFASLIPGSILQREVRSYIDQWQSAV